MMVLFAMAERSGYLAKGRLLRGGFETPCGVLQLSTLMF